MDKKPEEKRKCVNQEIFKVIPSTKLLAQKTIVESPLSTNKNLITGLTISELKNIPPNYLIGGIALTLIIIGTSIIIIKRK